MKITIIYSSPNTDGLTANTAQRVQYGAQSRGADTELIQLNSLNIGMCRACGNGWGTCRTDGRCCIEDDFGALYEQLVESDGIVLVSAVYWSGMTESLKAFIDRLRRCEALTNRFLNGKRCLLVACAGGSGNGTLECLGDMQQVLMHMGVRAYDRIPVNRFNAGYMLPALEQAGAVYADRLAID